SPRRTLISPPRSCGRRPAVGGGGPPPPGGASGRGSAVGAVTGDGPAEPRSGGPSGGRERGGGTGRRRPDHRQCPSSTLLVHLSGGIRTCGEFSYEPVRPEPDGKPG